MGAVAERVALEPFTLAHFLAWVDENELTLDDESDWAVEPFQQAIIEDLLGPAREVWAIIPEGNAKTTLFGGVALYQADLASSPWIPIGAASRDQAEIMFGQAAGFVQRSKALQKRFRVFEGYRKIKHLKNGGRGIKVYAADAGTGDGVIPYPAAYIDEPHRAKDMSLYRLWRGKCGKRGAKVGLMSTAGEPDSEFEDLRENIRQQADDRTYDGVYLRAVGKGLIYHEWMVRKPEEAENLELVKEANPLEHITIDYLREKRESLTLDYGTDWLRLTCNIPTRSSEAAIPEKEWDQAADAKPLEGPIGAGLDVGFLGDTTAIVPGCKIGDDIHLADPYILEPPRDGQSMLDVQDIKDAFEELKGNYQLEFVVMDRARAEDIAQWLENELDLIVILRPQTNEFAAKDYENIMAGLRERTLHHTGHEVFRQHVLSAITARVLGDKKRFDRPRTQRKAAKDRRRIVIDALTSTGMLVSALKDQQTGSPLYDWRDLDAEPTDEAA